MLYANSYVKIDLDAILANYRSLCRKANVPVMAIIKADAYGHGAVPVAKALSPECGFFGVSSVAEAVELRRAGIAQPILILGHTPPRCYPVAVEKDIRVAIFSMEDAQALSREAVRQGKQAAIHFAVDTGMSRIGLAPTEASADLCQQIARLPGLVAEGLFSHFATADEEDLSKTHAQAEKYFSFEEMLKNRGVTVQIRHLDNSAGILNFGAHADMVRGGISLYGLYPSDRVDKSLALKPAMHWYSSISYLKTLPAGRELSYGGTYVTKNETRVATVPVGYADGYRRCLGNRFYVLIRGKKAPILGRVCMDQMLVDVTDIPDAALGDRVVLMGKSGQLEISAETIAQAAGSFNYEQVCDVARRVERVYLEGGEEKATVNYLL